MPDVAFGGAFMVGRAEFFCARPNTADGWCNCGCGVSAVNLRAARAPQSERVETSSRLCFCSLRGDEGPCAE
jgi:hypothetical protein